MRRIKQKMMAGSVMMACLTLGAGGLHAQVTNLATITATAQVQGAYNYSYNSKTHVATYSEAAPTKVALDTKQLLARMATAENAEGNYGSTTFPSGAKLVAISENNSPDFQVLTSKDAFLVDVSDLLSVTNPDDISVQSFKASSQYELLTPSETQLGISTLTYNDIGAVGSSSGIEFDLSGLATSVNTDSTPNSKTLAYKETQTFNLNNGAGDGSYQDTPMVITGSLSGSGSVNLTAP
jgi:hypothetical protein